jgi:hypothetical protein
MKSYLWYQLDVYDGLVYHMLPVSLDCQVLITSNVYYIQNIYISFDSILTTSTQPGYRIVYICIAVGDPDIKKGGLGSH